MRHRAAVHRRTRLAHFRPGRRRPARGFFYTARPVGYKYFALGDALVFTLMGPLMVIGSYFVLTGSYNHAVPIASLPVGCLVAAILHANNMRDIQHDCDAQVRTVANLLGHDRARFEYYALVGGAYVAVLGMIAGRLVVRGACWCSWRRRWRCATSAGGPQSAAAA